MSLGPINRTEDPKCGGIASYRIECKIEVKMTW